MVVTHIHLWNSSAKTGYGHISLQIEGGCYISFWPKNHCNHLEAIIGCEGIWYESFEDEVKKQGYPNTTQHVMDFNTDKIEKWWSQFTRKDPEWSLLLKSCSNIVFKALCEGSDWFKGRLDGFVTTPKAVAELVGYYLQNKTAKICFSTCKACKK